MGKCILGLDVGSSSVKAALLDIDSNLTVASAQFPAEEMPIQAPHLGWAEQHPDLWWDHVVSSVRECLKRAGGSCTEVVAVGIAYQMHGLVVVDKDLKPLRPSIIWCDSRAVSIGEKAWKALTPSYCLGHLLNSPGNFTASKLRWVKENEPSVYEKIKYAMLPGDYIAMKLTGEVCTTDTGLSEGTLWDFSTGSISKGLLDHYGIDASLIPPRVPVFSTQGTLRKSTAEELGLPAGIPIAYRAGDQPNNAFSLKVLHAGETAATAGTSGVIYGVVDRHAADVKSRVNTFIHVNNSPQQVSNGILLCVNGTGILNSWLRKIIKSDTMPGYEEMNREAEKAPIGSEGLTFLPFGNGSERVLGNKNIGATMSGLDFNRHSRRHLLRAAQEGIVFSLKYGFDILTSMGLNPTVIRAGHANMFLSPLFREAFVNTIGAPLELFETDGAAGAARGAGLGSGTYRQEEEAFRGLKRIRSEEVNMDKQEGYLKAYQHWLGQLNHHLNQSPD